MYSHRVGLIFGRPVVYFRLHVCEQRRLWRDCVDAQARLSLRWSPMLYHNLMSWLNFFLDLTRASLHRRFISTLPSPLYNIIIFEKDIKTPTSIYLMQIAESVSVKLGFVPFAPIKYVHSLKWVISLSVITQRAKSCFIMYKMLEINPFWAFVSKRLHVYRKVNLGNRSKVCRIFRGFVLGIFPTAFWHLKLNSKQEPYRSTIETS